MTQRLFGTLTLRPTRLAFFIDPGDLSHLQQAIEINTCVWGGILNPILPHKNCLHRKHYFPDNPPTDQELIDNCIRTFEPEVLVVPDASTFPRTSMVRDREVVTISSLHGSLSNNAPGVSLSMYHLYSFLWKDSFQFEHRVKTRFIMPQSPPTLAAFAAANWGAFPPRTESSDFAEWYKQLTSPDPENFTEQAFAAFYENDWQTPLLLTLSQTRTVGQGGSHIMLVQPEEPLDIMAFWTLRALGHSVLPVPLQWRKSMLPLVSKIVVPITVRNRYPVTICRGPKTPFRFVREYANAFANTDSDAVASPWYPRIWSRDFLRFERRSCRLEADSATIEAACEESRIIRIRALTPKFVQRMGWTGEGQWTNCFESWSSIQEDDQALVLPDDLTHAQRLFGMSGGHDFLASRDGVLVKTQFPDHLQWMRVPTGPAVIHHWLQECGFETRTSPAGNLAASLTRAMGGPRGMYWLGYPGLIESLNHMASLPGRHVKPKQAIERLIQDALKASDNALNRTHEDIFNWLLEHGALRLGLATPCTECQQQNWYPVDDIQDRLACERCGKNFRFPSKNPKSTNWMYSLAGPFSVPGYVSGGYGSVAALHMLSRTRLGECMWAFGVEMKDTLGSRSSWNEIDVVAMVEEHGFAIPLFIEAKSGLSGPGGTISEDEIKRAEYLLSRFSTGVAVFSTMAVTFEPETATRLQSLVDRLPSRAVGRYSSAKPVVLLGQHELFGAFSLSASWQAAGGKHSEFAKTWTNVHSMLDICSASQELHLRRLQQISN